MNNSEESTTATATTRKITTLATTRRTTHWSEYPTDKCQVDQSTTVSRSFFPKIPFLPKDPFNFDESQNQFVAFCATDFQCAGGQLHRCFLTLLHPKMLTSLKERLQATVPTADDPRGW